MNNSSNPSLNKGEISIIIIIILSTFGGFYGMYQSAFSYEEKLRDKKEAYERSYCDIEDIYAKILSQNNSLSDSQKSVFLRKYTEAQKDDFLSVNEFWSLVDYYYEITPPKPNNKEYGLGNFTSDTIKLIKEDTSRSLEPYGKCKYNFKNYTL